MSNTRKTLRRWHLWLGWLVGVPMLLWTVSGVVMTIRPIETVRGETLLGELPAVRLAEPPVAPAIAGLALKSLSLEPRADGTRWVVVAADGKTRLADPANGRWLEPVGAAAAVREVTSRYKGTARVAAISRTDPENPPTDLRRPVAAWQVRMSDGTNFYVDSGSGAVIARRTRWWRFYDLMWGLHIMDLQDREDFNHPVLVVSALVSAVSVLMALVLLPLASRRKKRTSASKPANRRG